MALSDCDECLNSPIREQFGDLSFLTVRVNVEMTTSVS